MTYNLNTGYGLAESIRLNLALPVMGRLLVVCPSTDANYDRLSQLVINDPEGNVRLFTTLAAAYDAATTNANDVIALSGNAVHSVTTGIAWSKSRIHVIGMDSGDRYLAQGARVQSATADTTAYVIRNTGTRNTFRNIKFIQAGTANTCLHVIEEGGEGTVYKNCQFMFGVVDNLDLTTATEFVNGCDSGTFIKCTFGAPTLTTTASGGRTVMTIDTVTGGAAACRDNVFEKCIFTIESSDADSKLVSMAASGDAKGINYFDECAFIASLVNGGGIALNRAVTTANGLTDGCFLYAYPRAFNITNFGTNGTNNDNLQVVAPLNVNTDIVGVAPIAT